VSHNHKTIEQPTRITGLSFKLFYSNLLSLMYAINREKFELHGNIRSYNSETVIL